MPSTFLRRLALRLSLMRWYPSPTGTYIYLAVILPDAVRMPGQPNSLASLGIALLCILFAYWFFPWYGNSQYLQSLRSLSHVYKAHQQMQLIDSVRTGLALSLALLVIYIKLKYGISSLSRDPDIWKQPLAAFALYSPLLLGLADYFLSGLLKRAAVQRVSDTPAEEGVYFELEEDDEP
ncbi:hypothetical protein IT575_04375 [bacterium]|nr:hypothetical protein [bacterium]